MTPTPPNEPTKRTKPLKSPISDGDILLWVTIIMFVIIALACNDTCRQIVIGLTAAVAVNAALFIGVVILCVIFKRFK